AAAGRGDGAGLEVIAGTGGPGLNVEVHVRVHRAWQYQLARGIDMLGGAAIQAAPDRRDLVARDTDLSREHFRGGDQGATGDDQVKRCHGCVVDNYADNGAG